MSPVTEHRPQAPPPMFGAQARQDLFTPPVCAAACFVVSEVIPGVARGAIVFADSAPLPLGKIGPPEFPPRRLGGRFLQSLMLRSWGSFFGHVFQISSSSGEPGGPILFESVPTPGLGSKCYK